MSPSGTEREHRLRAEVDKQRIQRNIPGIVLRVSDPESEDLVVTSGVSARPGRGPIPADGCFAIGSTTKTFAAALILQLIHEMSPGHHAPARLLLRPEDTPILTIEPPDAPGQRGPLTRSDVLRQSSAGVLS